MLLSQFSEIHLPSTCQPESALPRIESILGERTQSPRLGAHYVQVRGSQSFIRILGPVKATQLCTALTHTKTQGPLNGLPAGLFTVMGFSHSSSQEKDDPILLQIVWLVVELFNLCGSPLISFRFLCLCSNNANHIFKMWFASYGTEGGSFGWSPTGHKKRVKLLLWAVMLLTIMQTQTVICLGNVALCWLLQCHSQAAVVRHCQSMS